MNGVRQRMGAWLVAIVSSMVAIGGGGELPAQGTAASSFGRVEADMRSAYSKIRVRKSGDTRTLLFIRDSGEEVVESMVDLERPHDLLIEYTQFMFLSYVHRPDPKRVLIVGLGGGSMVHFLRKYDPAALVDVVEIDKSIIDVANKYFDVRTEGNVKVIQADGFKYLAETKERYDVIFMDAFLKPSRDTDPNGVPLALKTARFYKQMQDKLTTGGLVVYNLNPHAGSRTDVAGITSAFRQTYVYQLPRGGYVVVASMAAERDIPSTILRQAKLADKRFGASFSLERLAYQLLP